MGSLSVPSCEPDLTTAHPSHEFATASKPTTIPASYQPIPLWPLHILKPLDTQGPPPSHSSTCLPCCFLSHVGN